MISSHIPSRSAFSQDSGNGSENQKSSLVQTESGRWTNTAGLEVGTNDIIASAQCYAPTQISPHLIMQSAAFTQ